MYEDLIEVAKKARENAYAPYSEFKVGAALKTKTGRIFEGCNIENSALSMTNCAERTAFFKAISEGEKEFEAIAIVGGKDNELITCPPCGACRQVMNEFCDKDFKIILFDGKDEDVYTLQEILPLGFKL